MTGMGVLGGRRLFLINLPRAPGTVPGIRGEAFPITDRRDSIDALALLDQLVQLGNNR